MSTDVSPSQVRPGDWADHKSRALDPRRVATVDHASATITLQIGTLVSDPVPMGNYTFERDAVRA